MDVGVMAGSFQPLEDVSRLHDGYRRCFSIEGVSLLLVQTGSTLFLIENRCPHMDWPLESGDLIAGEIICPKHRIRFDLATGEARAPGSLEPLRRFQTQVKGVHLGLDTTQLL